MNLKKIEAFLKSPTAAIGFLILAAPSIAAAAGVKLPGSDPSDHMEAAGTVIHFFNTALFVWLARILAGICIIGAAWNIKEMRLMPAGLSFVAAAIIGTAPAWVKGAFNMMESGDIFDRSEAPHAAIHYAQYPKPDLNGTLRG